MKWLRNIWNRIRLEIQYRKKLKELRKNLNDPSFNSKIAHQYIDNIVQIKVEFMNIYVKLGIYKQLI